MSLSPTMARARIAEVMLDFGTKFGSWGQSFLEAPNWLFECDLRLEHLCEENIDELFSVTPAEVYDLFTIRPEEWTIESHRDYIRSLPDRGFVPYLVSVNGEIAGLTTFMDIRVDNFGLEIGHTYILPKYRGCWVNPCMKRLMIGYAIEKMGAHRVQLKTDGRNFASQKAMRSMGFSFEGILRKHICMPDGFLRDTHMFSVISEEWPEVKRHLLETEQARGRGSYE